MFLSCYKFNYICGYTVATAGRLNHIFSSAEAECEGGLTEEAEEIEVLELDFDKALEMIYNGQIQDAKTIILLQYAKIHNLF